jgi:cellulose biosynthesis protein BcsQ
MTDSDVTRGRPELPTARVMLLNNKGGVGKTLTTRELAIALAQRGHLVLAVDMDPQYNLSRRLGVTEFLERPDKVDLPTLTDALRPENVTEGGALYAAAPCPWREIPARAEWAQRIDVLPSTFDLENRVSEAGVAGAVRRFAKIMTAYELGYDFVLVDCPPSLGHLTQMVAYWARFALLVGEPEKDGVDGMWRAGNFVRDVVPDLGNEGLEVIGAVLNRYRAGTSEHERYLAACRETLGDLLWEPFLSLRTDLATVMSEAEPVDAMPREPREYVRAVFEAWAKALEERTAA